MRATAFATLILVGLTTSVGASAPARAQSFCPAEASRALDEAQKILRTGDPEQFATALSCLTIALAKTQAELDGLREGRVAFSGQVNAPKGFVMSKPSSKEGR